ncbi:MAG: hypothetical protein U5K69_20125 [Balneolaceae bacterium]|nr:hypothetical protein [Balneolaceae bacterium]
MDVKANDVITTCMNLGMMVSHQSAARCKYN